FLRRQPTTMGSRPRRTVVKRSKICGRGQGVAAARCGRRVLVLRMRLTSAGMAGQGNYWMRVLIVGENASLRMGGEATSPYFLFKLLRERGIETWLVGHGRVRDELSELLPDALDRILLLDDSPLDRFLYNTGLRLPKKINEQTIAVLAQVVNQY